MTRADETTALEKRIVAAIRESGRITFRDFMERALYEPRLGYYRGATTPWSEGADYVTGPQVDAAFGVAIATLARECDARLASPHPFDVVECGGGDGTLLKDFCDATAGSAPALYDRLRLWSIERGEAARARQRERLGAHAEKASWAETLDAVPDGTLRGLVVSNELVDALPVHRVSSRAGALRERFVDVVDDALVEVEGDPSTPLLAEYLELNGITLRDGQVAEICLAAAQWLTAAAAKLHAGCILSIDYGADSAALYGDSRPHGSLVCQYRYQLNDDVFRRVGEQDITAHVDFGNLRRVGEDCGLATLGESSLAVFLVGFGAADGAAIPESGATADLQRHLGLRHLLFSEIADAHRVLLQAKELRAPIEFGRRRLERAYRSEPEAPASADGTSPGRR